MKQALSPATIRRRRSIRGGRVAIPAVALVALALGACSDLAMEPDRRPTTLIVSPDTFDMMQGDSAVLEVQVLDQNGEPFDRLPAWAPPSFSSLTPDRLTFDGQGGVVAVGSGDVRAVVELAGLETQARIRVHPNEIGVEAAAVYVTQGVQRIEGDMPLIAGRDGFLRVFVIGDRPNFFETTVEVTFYQSGAAVLRDTLDFGATSIPLTIEEGWSTHSFNLPVPGSVLQPGTGLVIRIDPDDALPTTTGSALRLPATGELALDVVTVPPFEVTMVPVVLQTNGTTSRVTDAVKDQLLQFTYDVFPMSSFDSDVRASYTSTADLTTGQGWSDLLWEIRMLRSADGSSRYYYGAVRIPNGSPWGGLGYIAFPASIGSDISVYTIAHELGHNFGLYHAPCGGPGNPDPQYPYENATLGHFGYELTTGGLKDPQEYRDLMSYCGPEWISDFHWEKTRAYRDSEAAAAVTAVRSPEAAGEALIVWGGVRDGELVLKPALTVDAPASLPTGNGPYRLEGYDAAGARLFSLSFDTERVDHTPEESHFSFAIPAATAGLDRLAELRLTGPEGRAVRRAAGGTAEVAVRDRGAGVARSLEGRWNAQRFPLAIVRDAATGQILALSETGTARVRGRTAAEVEVLLSDGLRARPARMRTP